MFDYELAFSSKRFKFLFEYEIKLGATCLSFSTRMFEQKENSTHFEGKLIDHKKNNSVLSVSAVMDLLFGRYTKRYTR